MGLIKLTLITGLIFLLSGCFEDKFGYFNQQVPGNIPEVFAQNVISQKDRYEMCATYSPDKKELYFMVSDPVWNYGKIVYYRFDKEWAVEDTAFLAHMTDIGEPFVSPDNKYLYFMSTKGNTGRNSDIWYCKREGDNWSEPVRFSSGINSDSCEFHPTSSLNGNLYFLSERVGGMLQGDIFCSEFKDGAYQEPYRLAYPVNTEKLEADPYISPDESYIIFARDIVGGLKNLDLFISFRKGENEWTEAIELGDEVNTDFFEFSPKVTPDGKYLMFSRREKWVTDIQTDIYWVSIEEILNRNKE